MKINYRDSIRVLAKFAIAITLLGLVFSQVDLHQFWQTVKAARWQYMLAVWAVTLVIFWLQSIKMQFIFKRQGCDVGWSTVFGVSAIASLYGMVLPGMLSVSVKWYMLKRNTGKGGVVLSSMVYNQLAGMVIITVFGLAALIITYPTAIAAANSISGHMFRIACGVLLVLIIAITMLLLNGRTGGSVIKALKRLLTLFPLKISQKGQTMLEQISVFQSIGGRFHLLVALTTVLDSLVCGVLTYLFAAKGANATAPLGVFVWLSSAVYILRRVPISIANLGVREAILVFFLSVYGVESSAAILMSMILFSGSVFIAAIGAVYQVYWSLYTDRTITPFAEP